MNLATNLHNPTNFRATENEPGNWVNYTDFETDISDWLSVGRLSGTERCGGFVTCGRG